MDVAELQSLMEDHKTTIKTVKLQTEKNSPQEKQKELDDIKHLLQKKMKQLVQDRKNENLKTALHKQAPGEEEGQGRGTGCTGPEFEGPHKTKKTIKKQKHNKVARSSRPRSRGLI